MSFDIATSILRKLSACRSRAELNSTFEILVRPSTRKATSSPNRRCISSSEVTRVLDRVVEQAGRDRDAVHAQVEQDARHLERVDQIGLAREALLALVHLRREDVGPLEQLEIAVGIDLEHAIGDVVEAEQSGIPPSETEAWRSLSEPRPARLRR